MLSLIPLPYRLLALAALALALVGYGWLKGAEHGEQKLAAYVSKQDKEHIQALNRAGEKTRSMQAKKDEALNVANERTRKANAAANAARATADGLRLQLAASLTNLPNASCGSVREYAATLSSVFGECSARLESLGRAAEGHAIDALMLESSWPKN